MDTIPSWANGSTLNEPLSNDSVMILFNNETSLSSELPAQNDLSPQSFFISNPNSLKSDLLGCSQSLDNIALNAFQLDANGQLVPVYSSDLEDENRLLFENENLDSNLLLLKNSSDNLNLKNILVNDIIITVPFSESKLPDFLNLQLKSKDATSTQQPPATSADTTEYVEERLKIFQNILVENKKKRIKRPRVENPSSEPQYTCEFCSMKFEKSHQYYGHLHVHSGEQTWDCGKCESSFTTQYQLRRHERRYHQDLRPHVCSVCNKTFERLSQLDYHRRRVHENERSFKCQICSKAFFKRSDLKTHINIHLKVNGCVCETCGRRFSHVSNLIRHKRTHSGIRPYLCRTCGRRFSQVTTLNEHQFSTGCRSQTKTIDCSYCSQPFAPHLLREHLLDAHGIAQKKSWKPVAEKRRFYCKICGDRFPFMNTLKKHEHDVHSVEQSLSCWKCKKEFGSLDLLLAHCCEKKNKSSAAKAAKRKNKNTQNSKTEPSKVSKKQKMEPVECVLIQDDCNIDKVETSLKNELKSTDISSSFSNCVKSSILKSSADTQLETSMDPLSRTESTSLDLNVEMMDTSMKQVQNFEILEKETFSKDCSETMSDETKLESHFLSGDQISANYVTIDLDFSKDLSINGILNASNSDCDKNLPPLVSISNRFDKDMLFESHDTSSCENTLIKLVGSDSCLDYKTLLNDSNGVSDSLNQYSSENLYSNSANALILSDVSYDTSLNQTSQLNFDCDKLTKTEDAKDSILYLPQSNMDGDILDKNEGMHDMNSDENLMLLNEYLTLNNVKPTEEPVYVCTHCSKVFLKLEELNQHIESLNENSCKMTYGQKVASKTASDQHSSSMPDGAVSATKSKTTEMGPHNCVHCNGQNVCKVCAPKIASKTSSSAQVSNRLASEPKKSKTKEALVYNCLYCHKAFTKLKNLSQHIGLHSEQHCRFQCDICDQKFAWKTSLNRHRLSHHVTDPPKFTCEMCDKTYSTITRVHEHVKRDHYNQRPHICKICAKCFFKKSDLKAHMRTHTQEKPYMCGTCAKSFRHVSHLLRHERTHMGIKPYKCSHCPGSFSQMAVLKNHIKVKHPDVVTDKT